MDVLKQSLVPEDVDCGLNVQNNVRPEGGVMALMEGLGALIVGDNPVSPSRCAEGSFQVAIG